MRWRWVFAVTVVMAVGTGCPETWRKGGMIDRAMAKDIAEGLRRYNCHLSRDEWRDQCRTEELWEDLECPPECQFRIAE
jgi:hypothetical protein